MSGSPVVTLSGTISSHPRKDNKRKHEGEAVEEVSKRKVTLKLKLPSQTVNKRRSIRKPNMQERSRWQCEEDSGEDSEYLPSDEEHDHWWHEADQEAEEDKYVALKSKKLSKRSKRLTGTPRKERLGSPEDNRHEEGSHCDYCVESTTGATEYCGYEFPTTSRKCDDKRHKYGHATMDHFAVDILGAVSEDQNYWFKEYLSEKLDHVCCMCPREGCYFIATRPDSVQRHMKTPACKFNGVDEYPSAEVRLSGRQKLLELAPMIKELHALLRDGTAVNSLSDDQQELYTAIRRLRTATILLPFPYIWELFPIDPSVYVFRR
ncbi:hypothetical protein M422DRAFT_245623 [Sphaerobolus stellatus SS14]|nr:hypothetical protein M422DRAFT_245623 [Sphaerobolus stellatus SS14]